MSITHSPLFAAGFRPFFLLSGLYAGVVLPLWLALYVGVMPQFGLAPLLWHGHEMIFGFVVAAISGFLLTAVPNWTNSRPVTGAALAGLVLLWLAGRAAVLASAYLPLWLVAVVDLAYLPLLGVALAAPLIAAGRWRNIAFLFLLLLLFVGNLLVYGEVLFHWDSGIAGLHLAIMAVALIVAVVGGRIVPSFTANWLRLTGRPVMTMPLPWLERAAVLSLAAVGAAVVLIPHNILTGALALLAAVIHTIRLSRWHGLKTLTHPILWVLHLGYLALVLGLVLVAVSTVWPPLTLAVALHALTAGCFGLMILGMMSRVSLGHTGRELRVSGWIVTAYVFVAVGTVLRLIAPLFDRAQIPLLHSGGSLWALAFLIFVIVYTPILLAPRPDGRSF